MGILVFIWLVLSGTGQAEAADVTEQCRAKLKEAQKLEVLHELHWSPGTAPQVVVGPTFHRIPYDSKQIFLTIVNCLLVGGAQKYVNFDVLDHMNHRVVGSWSNGRYKARE